LQSAWGAARKKNSYLQAQFLCLKARRGAKKAAIAMAASILTTVYHMQRDGTYTKSL
jgi:transposase